MFESVSTREDYIFRFIKRWRMRRERTESKARGECDLLMVSASAANAMGDDHEGTCVRLSLKRGLSGWWGCRFVWQDSVEHGVGALSVLIVDAVQRAGGRVAGEEMSVESVCDVHGDAGEWVYALCV